MPHLEGLAVMTLPHVARALAVGAVVLVVAFAMAYALIEVVFMLLLAGRAG